MNSISKGAVSAGVRMSVRMCDTTDVHRGSGRSLYRKRMLLEYVIQNVKMLMKSKFTLFT